jgi:hypothetical protein
MNLLKCIGAAPSFRHRQVWADNRKCASGCQTLGDRQRLTYFLDTA